MDDKLPRGLGARAKLAQVQPPATLTALSNERKLDAARLIDAGKTFTEVSQELKIPIEIIEKESSEWLTSLGSTRFRAHAKKSFTPSERLAEVMPRAAQMLEERNVEGFFETVAPIAAMQLAKDAITASDEKIRHSAQKDLLDRAGFKPKTQVEVYTKYDRMQKDELVASLRGALMANPAFAIKVLELHKAVADGRALMAPRTSDDGADAIEVLNVTPEDEIAQEIAEEFEL